MIRKLRFGWIVFVAAVLGLSSGTASACPFCTATSLTFCQEIAESDLTVIAKLVHRPDVGDPLARSFDLEAAKATFEVTRVIRGKESLGETTMLRVTYFGRSELGTLFLLMGIDPPKTNWSTPIPVTDHIEEYLVAAVELPTEGHARLEFFQKYLEDKDEMLARDAYDEFARVPYKGIIALKEKMNHDRLVEWITDAEVPANRRRLYLTMLGVCGNHMDDVPMLEKMITSTDRKDKVGFDALVGCYLTLKGEAGLKLIEDRFLRHEMIDGERVNYADTHNAVQALRFHGEQAHVIPKERILASFRVMLDRPKLADLVIPDLARWQDWDSMERLVTIFKESDDETPWIRTPILMYLKACPRPEAKKHLADLGKLDPDAMDRASAFAPLEPIGGKTATEGKDGATPSEPKATTGSKTTPEVTGSETIDSKAANWPWRTVVPMMVVALLVLATASRRLIGNRRHAAARAG